MTTADGQATNHSTTYTYTATTQKAALGTRWKQTTVDGFGRTVKVESGHDTTTESQTESEYAPCGCSPLGKLKRTSLPHAPGAAVKWTTYVYDGLGRTLSVTAPDGSVTTYSYQGNAVTVVDAAGKWKRSVTDVFGNLVRVEEPNPAGGANYVTSYTYTLLNQLTQVSMPRLVGSNVVTQTRTFTYSGSQVATATNPENGTVNYYYNADQKIEHRDDAKGQRTMYEYDANGRLSVVRHYPVIGQAEDASQRVTYTYDSQSLAPGYTQYGYGRMAAVEFTAGGASGKAMRYLYTYNPAGRVTGRKMQVWNGSGWFDIDQAYTYDNEGRATQMTHPDGTVYGYGFDAMGRVNSMTQGATTVASATFGVAGQITAMQYLGIGETRTYNDLLQMTRLTANDGSGNVLDMEYRYTAARNSGRIAQAKDWVSGEEVSYTYDSLNRLATAATTDATWGLRFTYDGFGNLTDRVVTKGSAPAGPIGVDGATNRLIGQSYDGNGNLLGAGNVWDVENRLVTDNATAVRYGYDDGGKRVWKWTAAASELYAWGLDGKRLATYVSSGTTYNLAGSNVYFGGKLLKAAGQTVVLDRLGSVRWKGNGERYHYFPYGEEYASDSSSSRVNGKEKFGTYFRDAESGLDYADQRYYAAGTGRFMTADTGPFDLTSSGSFNRYNYSYGDPVNFSDPDGALPKCTQGSDTSSADSAWCVVYALYGNYSPGQGGGGGGTAGEIRQGLKPGEIDQAGVPGF